jgi:hypothetical protein
MTLGRPLLPAFEHEGEILLQISLLTFSSLQSFTSLPCMADYEYAILTA